MYRNRIVPGFFIVSDLCRGTWFSGPASYGQVMKVDFFPDRPAVCWIEKKACFPVRVYAGSPGFHIGWSGGEWAPLRL
jgi:hypothetical protein